MTASPPHRHPAPTGDAEARDAAAGWRLPRVLAVLEAAAPGFAAADAPPRRVLVAEPGRGRLGRLIADRLRPGDAVTLLAGIAEDRPPAPGGRFDEHFVEHREHAASLDVRTLTTDRWPLDAATPDFDLIVLDGCLTAEPATASADAVLEEARGRLAADGRLVAVEDEPATLLLHPPVPRIEAAWSDRCRRLAVRGRDASIIRRLPERLDRHRLRARCSGVASLGAVHEEPEFRGVIDLLADLLRAGPGGDSVDPEMAIESLEAWRRRPGGAVWWTMAWVAAGHA